MTTRLNTSQKGFTLVELLVAMVVGLLIVGGAFSLHVTSRDTQVANEMQMDMVADARFAIELISYDLRHAGLWGGNNIADLLLCKSTDATCNASTAGESLPTGVSVTNDCFAGWFTNLSFPVMGTDDSAGNPYAGTCIPASEGYMAGTDILEVKYTDPNPPPSPLLANQVYIRSNATSGRVFVGTTEPELESYDDLASTHELKAHVYYISNYTDSVGDGIPSLRRVALVNDPSLQNQMVVSGVADMQIQYGEDVTGDDVVDRYVDANNVQDWANVFSAKIWLLLRSDNIQQGVDTSKTFNIAGVPTTVGGQDGFRFFMVTSVVDMRNTQLY
jgi:type IV pilus assembly protein PilW